MSAVSPGAFSMTSDRYLPSPSCVMPRDTVTPVFGTSASLMVLLGSLKTASARSVPTLRASMSIAATKLMSLTWYPPRTVCIRPGMKSSALASL